MAVFVLALSSCAKTAPTLPQSSSLVIGVAGFQQPRATSDLLAGYMPEEIPRVDSKIFPQLDDQLEATLIRTHRQYVWSGTANACVASRPKQPTESAFAYWVSIGRCMNVDLLLVPQVIGWQERDGGAAGVERPAAVVMDFFLLDVRQQSLTRSRFDETQQALTDNLLEIGKFMERKGRWVTAHELAQEGMDKAVKELGL